MSFKLDDIDYNILHILQEDGNITNLELSKKVSLSPGPTLERVKKLEQQGVIRGYYAEIDPSKIGLGIEAIIEIALTHQAKDAINKFKIAAGEIEEITECYQVTGNVDFVVKAIVKDIPAYEKLITEKIGKIDVISNMRTRVILATTKKSKVLPVRYKNPKENPQSPTLNPR